MEQKNNIFKKIFRRANRLLWNFLKYFIPVQKNVIVINNFFGNGYGEIVRGIADELLKYDSLVIYWIVKEKNVSPFPPQIRQVKINTVEEKIVLSKAKVRISNVRNYHPIRLKRKQIYVLAWHGGPGFKLTEGRAEQKLSKSYLKFAKYDGKICDGYVPSFRNKEDMLRKAFWLNKDCVFLEFDGHPRDDFLYINNNPSYKQKVLEKYKLDQDVKYILYAPTFRDDGNVEMFNLDYQRIVNAFDELFKCRCKLIVRLHPNDANKSNSIHFSDTVINGTSFDNGQELTLISDVLISDYSSLIFDFLKLKKPFYFYVPDLENYIQLRGIDPMFYDFAQRKNKKFDELIVDITSTNLESTKECLEKEIEQFSVSLSYGTSKKIASWIVERMNK